jgi:hypothetical protein
MPTIVQIAIDSRVSEVGVALIAHIPQSSIPSFIDHWYAELTGPKSAQAAVAAMGWIGIKDLAPGVRSALKQTISDYAAHMGEEQFAAWHSRVVAHAPVHVAPVLIQLFPPAAQPEGKRRNPKEKR